MIKTPPGSCRKRTLLARPKVLGALSYATDATRRCAGMRGLCRRGSRFLKTHGAKENTVVGQAAPWAVKPDPTLTIQHRSCIQRENPTILSLLCKHIALSVATCCYACHRPPNCPSALPGHIRQLVRFRRFPRRRAVANRTVRTSASSSGSQIVHHRAVHFRMVQFCKRSVNHKHTAVKSTRIYVSI